MVSGVAADVQAARLELGAEALAHRVRAVSCVTQGERRAASILRAYGPVAYRLPVPDDEEYDDDDFPEGD